MLVELGLVEQRYRAVLEVLNDGASVTGVARRFGVARQTVHVWLRAYATGGLGALADRSSRPGRCPHQMSPQVEARVVARATAGPVCAALELTIEPGRSASPGCVTRSGHGWPANACRSPVRAGWSRSRTPGTWSRPWPAATTRPASPQPSGGRPRTARPGRRRRRRR